MVCSQNLSYSLAEQTLFLKIAFKFYPFCHLSVMASCSFGSHLYIGVCVCVCVCVHQSGGWKTGRCLLCVHCHSLFVFTSAPRKKETYYLIQMWDLWGHLAFTNSRSHHEKEIKKNSALVESQWSAQLWRVEVGSRRWISSLTLY